LEYGPSLKLDIDFREMGELSAFVHVPTLPDPKNV
jgi:hypothetical protein